MALKILQINIGKNKNAVNLLKTKYSKFDVIVIQEPYFNNKSGSIQGIPAGVPCIAAAFPRTAVLLPNKSLGFMVIEKEKDVILLSIQGYEKVMLANFYCSPNEDFSPSANKLEEILRKYNDRNKMIIAGDFNAKGQAWGPYKSDDPRAQIIGDIVSIFNLKIANDKNSPPTFAGARGSSWIDITLENVHGNTYIDEWNVNTEENLTDHNNIEFNVKMKMEKNEIHKRINWKRTNPDILKKELEKEIGRIRVQWTKDREINEIINEITDRIIVCCERAERKGRGKKPGGNHKEAPWWSAELNTLRKRVSAARRRWQRTLNDEGLRMKMRVIYKKLQALLKGKIRKAKFDCWRAFLENIDVKDPFGQQFSFLKGKPNYSLNLHPVKNAEGVIPEDQRETIQNLLEYHFPKDNREKEGKSHEEKRNSNYSLEQNDQEFTEEEVKETFRESNKNKAPGPDGIPMEVMVKVFEANPKLFTEILNICLRNGQFPKKWKKSKVVLFSKEGKNPENPSAYRPICLIDAWSKILDKLVTKRILYFLSLRKLISPNQFGFLPGRSTTMAIKKILKMIKKNKKRKKHTCILSFDIKGAFSNVWWEGVLHQLRLMRIHRNLYNLIRDYFKDREVFYENDVFRIFRKYSRGCPQGSNSGPLFWNIICDVLLRMPLPPGVTIQAYADDIVIIITGSSRPEIEKLGQKIIEILEKWCSDYKLELAADKTQMLFIPKSGKRKVSPRIRHKGKIIKCKKEMKYLGIIIDEGLTWIPHLNTTCEKIRNIAYNMSGVSRSGWGMSSRVLKAIYKRGIERIATYACGAWWPKNNVKLVPKTNKIQRIPLLQMTKAYRTISTAALQVLKGILPLDLQLGLEAKLYKIKNGRKEKKITKIGNKSVKIEEIETKEKILLHPATTNKITLKTATPAGANTEIFTDGSKMDGKVGAAFVVKKDGIFLHKENFRLRDEATVYQSEMHAIHKALQWIIENKLKKEKIVLFSDSLSALQSLGRHHPSNNLEFNIRNKVNEIKKGNKLSLSWIKAHVGHEGNELADMEAKKGTMLPTVTIKSKIPFSYVKKTLKEDCIKKWQERWREGETGRFTYKIFPNVNEKRNIGGFHIVQALSNHGSCPFYEKRFNLKTDGEIQRPCVFCDIEELADIKHWIMDCEGLKETRKKWIKNTMNTEEIFLGYLRNEKGRQSIAGLLEEIQQRMPAA